MINRKKLKHSIVTAILLGATVISLQGCVEMLVGTAVMGTFAATDRRTFGAQTEDKTIIFKGETRAFNLVGDRGHVSVTSFNRKMLLTGEVKDQKLKALVERELARIEGVHSVVNELEIAGASSYSSRSNDSLITSKVVANFVDAKDIFANSFKVVTERGIVYLMGRVTEREGVRAAEIVSGVSGVLKVVKVFEYISEDELQRLSNTR